MLGTATVCSYNHHKSTEHRTTLDHCMYINAQDKSQTNLMCHVQPGKVHVLESLSLSSVVIEKSSETVCRHAQHGILYTVPSWHASVCYTFCPRSLSPFPLSPLPLSLFICLVVSLRTWSHRSLIWLSCLRPNLPFLLC